MNKFYELGEAAGTLQKIQDNIQFNIYMSQVEKAAYSGNLTNLITAQLDEQEYFLKSLINDQNLKNNSLILDLASMIEENNKLISSRLCARCNLINKDDALNGQVQIRAILIKSIISTIYRNLE